ncbi:MAG: methylmalonyl-CoA mutase family protein [Thermaerobacterales bacterium]
MPKEPQEAKERREHFQTLSGISLDQVYTAEHLKDWNPDEALGLPGEFPFTRGVYPTMYRGRPWTMRQFAGFGTAAETNARFKYLLQQGQTGLSVAFDFPTLLGYDSDHEFSQGEVGKLGVAIDSLADMERLFEGIPLEEVSTSMTINGPAMVLYAMYLAVAEQQGADWTKLRGTIQNDILKEYIAQNTYIFPPRPSLKIITDIFEFSAARVPYWNTVSISGYHIREAGATAVQELAFTLANGFAYVEEGIKAGLDVDAFAPRLSFFWDIHNDFFEEIAKLRAARRIWARELKEKYGAKDPRSWMCRFHSQTAGVSLTAQQPKNNIVRVALQALAAVLGGTQSLHTNSYDEALALPTEEAVRIALRTQQIIADESGVTGTVDPLGGSFFLERLTDEMEAGARGYFEQIDRLGGVVAAIESGFFSREIADASYRFQRHVQEGEYIIVGVNRYEASEEGPPEILRIDEQAQKRQIGTLQQIKAERDGESAGQALQALDRAARDGENLMPHLLDCVRAYASLGEICDTLRAVYGEWRDQAIY